MKATLYVIPGSHPSMAARLMLELKGIEYRRVDLMPVISKAVLKALRFDGITVPALKIDGKVVDTRPMARSLPLVLPWDETFNVGLDTGTPVDDQDYQVPFRFTGTIDKLTIELGPEELTPFDRELIYGRSRASQ